MKHFVSLLLAVVLVGGTYVWAFVYDGSRSSTPAGVTDSRAGAGGSERGRRGGAGGQAAVVTLASVRVEPFTDLFSALGTVQADARVKVLSEASGRVTAVLMTPNIKVEAGALLVSLNDEIENIAVRTASIQLQQSEETLARYEKLASSGTLTNTSLAEAQVAVEIAQAALDKAEYELAQRSIVAPIAGTPGLTDIQLGAYLNTGTQIVTLTNTDNLVVEFSLPDRAGDLLRPGYPVRVTSPSRPGAVLEGEITAYDNEIDPQTRLIEVKARFANEAGALQPGAIVNVLVTNTNEPLPSIPVSALSWSRDGASVWVSTEGQVRQVPVIVRSRQDDTVWLDAALQDGEQVVTEGVQKLREGAQIVTLDQINQRSAEENRSATGEQPAQAERRRRRPAETGS